MFDQATNELQNTILQLSKREDHHLKDKDIGYVTLQDVDLSFSLIKSDKNYVANALFDLSFPLIVGEKRIDTADSDDFSEFKRNITSSLALNDTDTSKTSRKIFRSNNSSAGDVEGSPLRLQNIADLSDSAFCGLSISDSPNSSVSHPPRFKSALPIATGRLLLSAYAMLFDVNNNSQLEKNDDLPSLLVYLDGTDRKRTACMYGEPVKSSKFGEDKRYLGLKTVLISVKDPMPNDDHLPKIQNMNFGTKQIHFKSTYDIFGSLKEDKVQAQYQGSMLVEVEWEKQSQHIALLQQPPLEGRTRIQAKVSSGDMRSAAYVLYRELELLMSFVTGLSTGEVNWLGEKGDKCIIESLKALIEHLKLGDSGTPAQNNVECGEELSTIVNSLVFDERKDLDFVDHLWKVLMHCSSHSELVECFQYVFKVLISGELHPFIHRNNNTIFAQLVRESYTGKLRMPNLAGLYALELLAEMGAEKLHQDYAFAFLSKDLVTLSGLKPFLQRECQLSEKINSLEKMHNVLEMVVMLKLFLSNITQDNLVSISREMLKYFEQNTVSSNHTFTFSVPTSSVKSIIESCPPCSWKLEAVKLVDNLPEMTTILLVTKQPFGHLQEKQTLNFNNTVDDSDKDVKYFYVRGEEKISIFV